MVRVIPRLEAVVASSLRRRAAQLSQALEVLLNSGDLLGVQREIAGPECLLGADGMVIGLPGEVSDGRRHVRQWRQHLG